MSVAPSAAAAGVAAPSRRQLNYTLCLLFVVNIINMADRTILSVLLEPIRAEMALSDTQIGLLTGFAFALFYAVAGIFIARLADLYDRRQLLGVSLLIWSAMTALTGAVQSFAQFFLARIAVGVGESSAIPTSNAIIGDAFPPHRRPLALAVFTAGSFFGVLAGSLIGGFVGEIYGWRAAFVAAGLTGVPVAALVLMTMTDPPRRGIDGAAPEAPEPLARTLRQLSANRPYVLLVLSSGFITFMLFGVIGWFPAFLMRAHALSQSTVGLFFGTALGIGTAVGAVLGGVVANRLATRSLRWLTRLPLLFSLAFLPAYEIAIFAPDPMISLIFLGVASAIGGATLGPVLAAIQTVLPSNMRATGSGITGFSGSLIGLGGAPFVVGLLSDHFARTMGAAEALQRALGLAVLAALLVVALLLAAHRAFASVVATDR
jgi:predicted MFS family arabinose efflux permease